MTSTDKPRFYWARIGDGNYEPVAVRGKKGKRKAWTIGCPDPFEVDVPDPAIALLEREQDSFDGGPMLAPLTPEQEARAAARERRYQTLRFSHGYAGFGR